MEPNTDDYATAQDLLEYFKCHHAAACDEDIADSTFVTKCFFSAFLEVASDQFGPIAVVKWLRDSAADLERRISS